MLCIRIRPIKWLKPYINLEKQKKVEAEKKSDKVEKTLYKLMNIAAYGITMEKV